MPEEVAPITVEEALEAVLARFHPLDAEEVPLLQALDRVLAEDIVAGEDIPPFENSAMDGYAVRGEEVAGARRDTPVRLRVIGEVAAGMPATVPVEPGTAVRIMTGAPMPPGADTVVPFEQTDEAGPEGEREPGWVRVLVPVSPGSNVRAAGEDVRRGERVLERGTRLRPQEVGLLAALGRPIVRVTRRPRVVILATGDELVEPGEPLAPGKIRNSNAYSNYAQVLKYGGEPLKLPIARDRFEDLSARIDEGLAAGVDLFLTSGGVSVGEYDLVKKVLASRGKISFWRVRMQPGRPMAFGEIDGVPLLGLPGNPVSSMVSFILFVRPVLLKMQGQRALRLPEVTATLLEDARAQPDRPRFLRAIVEQEDGRFTARLTGPQGSGILSSMVRANGLAVIPESAYPAARAGTTVRVLMFDWPEIL
ncbi:MAG: gephyrin-like molybdotransferase Glp [Chloroflexia bacterium]